MSKPTTSEAYPRGLAALALLTGLLLLAALYTIFVVAPVEQQMGIVQKIFYFHVPSAYAMYVGFGASALGSAMYLFRRGARWDALGVAGAEVGMLFCLIVLTTGPLWARKAWGVYWTWDPRLTTTLLAGMDCGSTGDRCMSAQGNIPTRGPLQPPSRPPAHLELVPGGTRSRHLPRPAIV